MKINCRSMKQAEKLQDRIDRGETLSRRDRRFMESMNKALAVKESKSS